MSVQITPVQRRESQLGNVIQIAQLANSMSKDSPKGETNSGTPETQSGGAAATGGSYLRDNTNQASVVQRKMNSYA